MPNVHETDVGSGEPSSRGQSERIVRFVLTPSRSLGRTGFLVLMTCLAAASMVTGAVFLVLGAWPVPIFLGLDVAIVYVAFRLNYRSGRQSETIEIDEAELRLIRRAPSGESERITLNPYWVRVRLLERHDGGTRLWLQSHGRSVPFGGFLSDSERKELAPALAEALARQRSSTRG